MSRVSVSLRTGDRPRVLEVGLAGGRHPLVGVRAFSAYEEIHTSMTKSMVRLLRLEERERRSPSREVTDRLREYRQLTEALAEYRQSHATSSEAEAFFDSLHGRIDTLVADASRRIHTLSCVECRSPAPAREPWVVIPSCRHDLVRLITVERDAHMPVGIPHPIGAAIGRGDSFPPRSQELYGVARRPRNGEARVLC